MAEPMLFRVTGDVADWGEEDWLVVAESADKAKEVWADPTNGGNTEEDGFTFKAVEAIPGEKLLEYGGGDDGWGESLPEGAEVLTRYEGVGELDGQPDMLRVSAAALAKYFGEGIITDPLA